MATTVRPTDSILDLDLPQRAHNALWRNNVREVGELVNLSDVEFLRMRGVGPGTLAEVHQILAAHGLSMRTEPLPPADPAAAAEAEWIGRQLDALLRDARTQTIGQVFKNALSDTKDPERGVMARRFAWPFYRWAQKGMLPEDWPHDKAGGRGWWANPMPGSMELHMEGLNRLAHEELDA